MNFNVDDLIEQGLVKKKTYTEGRFKGLSVLKYSRKVFFDNLWHIDPRLLECRGLVVDEEDNVVVWPFTKVFNVGENFTEVDPEEFVVAPRKVNGFMASVTRTEKYGIIVATTGTLDSSFADIAKKHTIEKEGGLGKLETEVTYLFEICDKNDPHIVKEEEGAYLIGARNLQNGNMISEGLLDILAERMKVKRPKVLKCMFGDLPKVNHEGFMIRDTEGNYLAKVKSPHYLATKAFLRMGKKRVSLAWNNPVDFKKQIDEEFYEFHQWLLDNFSEEEYHSLHQEQRRDLINEYFNNRT